MENIELINLAKKARKNAYAPYSNFKVGACVLCESGKTYVGANIENVSFPLGCCAEKLAICTAIFNKEKITKIAIYSGKNYTFPCGACRQIIMEFNPETEVIVCNEKECKSYIIKDLLPNSFSEIK